ncbi:glutaredoxin family protein [Halomonas citrativorans]|uniref:Glutaredoxin family protein n=1 Tax=Halomonas citrativorans TaxID=2742612 RepID=A0ABR9FCH1_9GAMM|nr:glutaredoxin family protein [Halomonas citrativorans]MBE0404192.1 glutaredoxin family protein [Halomonas citrativorans]
MISLTLYTTLGCHLCAQLEGLLAALANQPVVLQRIEISDCPELLARYGELIPVVADSQGHELIRGFEVERLSGWLRQRGWLSEHALTRLMQPDEVPPKGRYVHNGRRFLGE